MDSDVLWTELPRLFAAATALFAGVTAAVAVRLFMHRGDGDGARRSVVALLAASGAAAFGSGFFIFSARLGYLPAYTLAYAASGLGAGLLAGLFPFYAGVPLCVLAAVVSFAFVSSVAPTTAWVDGAQAARLTVYSATEAATVCAANIREAGALVGERDLSLPPGPVALELSIYDIRGPFSAAFGGRRFRLDALVAGGERIPFGSEPGRAPITPAAALFLRLTGCRYSEVVSTGFMPEDMMTATYILKADGGILVDIR